MDREREGLTRGWRAAGAAALMAYGALVLNVSRADELSCRSLAKLDSRALRIVDAETHPAGEFEAADGAREAVPEFCRVRALAHPTADSHITIEIWLPASHWNGRYYQLGNGGFAGNISYQGLARELRAGSAVGATDTGHQGTSFEAQWARGHPERVIDYAYRSTSVTATAAHQMIEAYYGAPARHRYFMGCSNGGRQALMTAQRDPQLWDGIVAGAPAIRWTEQLAAFVHIQRALTKSEASRIPASKLPAIQRAALSSCTAEAGVVDRVPGDPRFCPFEPSALRCKDAERDDCLTAPQVEALKALQHGPPSYFGFEPTAASAPDGWQRWIVNDAQDQPSQRTFAEEFSRHFPHQVAGEPLARVLDATDTDLTAFAQRGGKVVMYFGWADAVIAPRSGVDYYERVSQRMGAARTREFFRLFMVPGMAHCQGGAAPNAFGQAAIAPAALDDARHDVRRAIEAWVERGKAPESLIAARYQNDDPHQGLAATRLLCPFPQRSRVQRASEVCVKESISGFGKKKGFVN